MVMASVMVGATGGLRPPPSRVVTALVGGVVEALGVEWDAMDGEQLAADVEALQVLTDRLDALRARVAAALDRSGLWAEEGHRSCAAMLARQAPHRHGARQGADVRHGDRLRKMLHVAEAFEQGLVTSDHIRVFATCLHPRYEGQFAEFEEQLLGYAVELDWKGWLRLVNLWKDGADRSDPDRVDEKDLAAREVHLSRSFNERGILSGTLTPHARQVVRGELDRLTEVLFRQDWAAACEVLGEGNVTADVLGRTPAQRRHDALLLMAERSAGAGEGCGAADAVVYVHCTEAELAASLEQVAGLRPEGVDVGCAMREYEDGTPISRRMLARLAIRSRIKRVVFDAAGHVLDLGRPGRLFSRSQREAIAVRDRVCRCGCGLSARLCEADHLIEVRDGGLTVVANGQALCHRSHRFKTLARTRNGSPDDPAEPPADGVLGDADQRPFVDQCQGSLGRLRSPNLEALFTSH